MAILYNIYANDGQGGDVNYASPIVTTASLTYTVGLLGSPSDNSFAIRAFDAVSGIEEANTDARVRVVIDASGNDVSSRPNAVNGLSAWPMAGGTCWVTWGYDSAGQGGPADRFDVTMTPGPSSSPAHLAASVAYLPGVVGYGCTISGLASNTTYTIAVQTFGTSAILASGVVTVAIHNRVNLLSGVDSLLATPSA